jgi:hypothetical protein
MGSCDLGGAEAYGQLGVSAYEMQNGWRSARLLGGDWLRGGFEMRRDHFEGRFFALTAAVGYREARLHVVQRGCAAVHAFPDLTITDAIAETDVHDESRRRI